MNDSIDKEKLIQYLLTYKEDEFVSTRYLIEVINSGELNKQEGGKWHSRLKSFHSLVVAGVLLKRALKNMRKFGDLSTN